MIREKNDSPSSADPANGPPHPDELIKKSDSGIQDSCTKYEERKATLKLDLIVMPLISMIFFISSLDRSNVGNARVGGLQSDLKLSDHQFSVALLLTSIFYLLIKIPATLVLKKIGAHILMASIIFLSGLVTFCQGFVTKFGHLAATRASIGLIGGGLYPIGLLYLSQTYSRDQLQLRIAIFSSAASLSGIVSGLLSYAIFSHMDGTWGKPGWAWLFFLEGLVTMAFSMSLSFIFPPSIKRNRWLQRGEKEVLLNRMVRKSPPGVDENEKFKISEVIEAIKSPHVFILTVTQFMCGVGATSIQYFTPTIVRSLGYSPSRTQLMTAPPLAVAFVLMLASSYFSGRYQLRAVTAGVGAALGLFGFLIFLTVDPSRIHVKYASLFLAIPGTQSMGPPILAWSSNNSFGHYRRAAAISVTFTTVTLGGIVGSWLFPTSQAPGYHPGIIINVLCCAGVIISVALNCVWLRYSTRCKFIHRNRILKPYGSDVENPNSPEFERAWKQLGDKHPDYQYVY